jgi:hypothetical protein
MSVSSRSRRLGVVLLALTLGLSCTGSSYASGTFAGGRSGPTLDVRAAADANGQFLDTVGDVNAAPGGNFYVSADILGSEIGFFDGDVGRTEDDTFGVFTLVDSMPAAGVTSRLLAGDRLWWWLDTDNNTATGAPVEGQQVGIDTRVMIAGVANGTPAVANYAIWNPATGRFGPDTQVNTVLVGSEFGWTISTTALGIQRGRAVGVLVESDNTDASAIGDSDFSPNATPLISFAIPGPPPPPIVAPGEPSAVTAGGLTLNGSINPGGSATSWFVRYGIGSVSEARTPDQSAGQGTTATAVSATLSGLRPSTTYQYQIVAKNPWGETAGPVLTASTSLPAIASLPVATTQARGIATDRLTLTGTVDPQGRPLTAYFEWGPSKKYGKRTPKVTLAAGKFGPTSVTGLVRNLKANARIHYRLVIEGDGARSQGQDLTAEVAVADRLIIAADPNGRCGRGVCRIDSFSIEVRVRDGDTNRVQSASSLRGVSARVRCTSKCSVNSRFALKKGRVLRGEIGSLFRGRSLPSGATIEVRVTGAGLTGTLFRASFLNDNLIEKTCELRGSSVRACVRG